MAGLLTHFIILRKAILHKMTFVVHFLISSVGDHQNMLYCAGGNVSHEVIFLLCLALQSTRLVCEILFMILDKLNLNFAY